MFRIPQLPLWTVLFCFVPLFYPLPVSPQVRLHEKIVLRGPDGNELTSESKVPYSPKKTCGTCHDYDEITNGYHFQQGRTDGTRRILTSDDYDRKLTWNLSSGLYGRHRLTSPDSSQLAKKVNRSPSEIDKSSFFFVQSCGPCHPGGGWGEYDRKGNLYYNEETKKFGYEVSGINPLLDGDYTSYNMGNGAFGAPWDRSGVSEADCLICHLKGYQWKERGAALRGRSFKYGPTVGAGWATLRLSEDEFGNPKADEITIDYNRKEISDFENLHQRIIKRPLDENCCSCHATPEGKTRGEPWGPETDVHKAKNLDCVYCHPGGKEHNFAKGNTLQEAVRDDLNQTMSSCEDCHYKGKEKKAPKYKHPFSPRHMKRIACQTCHIPYRTASADLVFDLSAGELTLYDTSRFLSNDPLDPKKSIPGVDPGLWYPAMREFKGRIVPVKPLVVIYWGDQDEKTGAVRPIPLWKIRELKKPLLKDDNGDGIPEVNTQEEIRTFLNALRGKDRFGNPVATRPALIKGGFLYRLNKKEEIEKIKHEQADAHDFSLSHNVMSGPNVIGAQGCKDCHAKSSSFFLRKILIDPYDEKGRPVYAEAWERLGISQEKLSRLLTEQ